MAANLPVAFGALLAGGLLLEHGISTTKAAFSGGTSASTPSTRSSSTTSSTSSSAGSQASGGTVVGAVTTGQLNQIGAEHGWSGQQIADWENIIKAESNGTTTDTNSSSLAYGIAQMYAGITGDLAANKAKYYTYGGNPNTVTGQLTAMANYIAQRYGTPSAAWSFHLANNSY